MKWIWLFYDENSCLHMINLHLNSPFFHLLSIHTSSSELHLQFKHLCLIQTRTLTLFFQTLFSILFLHHVKFTLKDHEFKLKHDVFCRLITSSWVLEFESSIQLEKCRVELNFFEKSVELNWEVEFKHSSQIKKLDSIIRFENSTWFNKILDKCK